MAAESVTGKYKLPCVNLSSYGTTTNSTSKEVKPTTIAGYGRNTTQTMKDTLKKIFQRLHLNTKGVHFPKLINYDNIW